MGKILYEGPDSLPYHIFGIGYRPNYQDLDKDPHVLA